MEKAATEICKEGEERIKKTPKSMEAVTKCKVNAKIKSIKLHMNDMGMK